MRRIMVLAALAMLVVVSAAEARSRCGGQVRFFQRWRGACGAQYQQSQPQCHTAPIQSCPQIHNVAINDQAQPQPIRTMPKP